MRACVRACVPCVSPFLRTPPISLRLYRVCLYVNVDIFMYYCIYVGVFIFIVLLSGALLHDIVIEAIRESPVRVTTCEVMKPYPGRGEIKRIPCRRGAVGSIIKIRQNVHTSQLALCEVEVYGYPGKSALHTHARTHAHKHTQMWLEWCFRINTCDKRTPLKRQIHKLQF